MSPLSKRSLGEARRLFGLPPLTRIAPGRVICEPCLSNLIMRATFANRRIWIFPVVVAIAWFLVHSIRYDWNFHARFSLLLQGHVFCRLESPGQFKEPPGASTGFVSKWVFTRGACIGYLNRYGDFVSSADAGNWDPLKSGVMVVDAILFYSEWILILIFTVVCGRLLWNFTRHATAQDKAATP
jgi:hypothetical protein